MLFDLLDSNGAEKERNGPTVDKLIEDANAIVLKGRREAVIALSAGCTPKSAPPSLTGTPGSKESPSNNTPTSTSEAVSEPIHSRLQWQQFNEGKCTGRSMTTDMYDAVWKVLSNNKFQEELTLGESSTTWFIMNQFDVVAHLATSTTMLLSKEQEQAIPVHREEGEISKDVHGELETRIAHTMCVAHEAAIKSLTAHQNADCIVALIARYMDCAHSEDRLLVDQKASDRLRPKIDTLITAPATNQTITLNTLRNRNENDMFCAAVPSVCDADASTFPILHQCIRHLLQRLYDQPLRRAELSAAFTALSTNNRLVAQSHFAPALRAFVAGLDGARSPAKAACFMAAIAEELYLICSVTAPPPSLKGKCVLAMMTALFSSAEIPPESPMPGSALTPETMPSPGPSFSFTDFTAVASSEWPAAPPITRALFYWLVDTPVSFEGFGTDDDIEDGMLVLQSGRRALIRTLQCFGKEVKAWTAEVERCGAANQQEETSMKTEPSASPGRLLPQQPKRSLQFPLERFGSCVRDTTFEWILDTLNDHQQQRRTFQERVTSVELLATLCSWALGSSRLVNTPPPESASTNLTAPSLPTVGKGRKGLALPPMALNVESPAATPIWNALSRCLERLPDLVAHTSRDATIMFQAIHDLLQAVACVGAPNRPFDSGSLAATFVAPPRDWIPFRTMQVEEKLLPLMMVMKSSGGDGEQAVRPDSARIFGQRCDRLVRQFKGESVAPSSEQLGHRPGERISVPQTKAPVADLDNQAKHDIKTLMALQTKCSSTVTVAFSLIDDANGINSGNNCTDCHPVPWRTTGKRASAVNRTVTLKSTVSNNSFSHCSERLAPSTKEASKQQGKMIDLFAVMDDSSDGSDRGSPSSVTPVPDFASQASSSTGSREGNNRLYTASDGAKNAAAIDLFSSFNAW